MTINKIMQAHEMMTVRKVKCKVKVHMLSGATKNDMIAYIKKLLKRFYTFK